MNKEKAIAAVRLFPSTRKRIKVKAARYNKTIAEYIDLIERHPLKDVPIESLPTAEV